MHSKGVTEDLGPDTEWLLAPGKGLTRLACCIGEGLGLACRDVRVGVQVVDEDRLDVLVRLLALICPLTVGHQMPMNSQAPFFPFLSAPKTCISSRRNDLITVSDSFRTDLVKVRCFGRAVKVRRWLYIAYAQAGR
jgi:hypothetical protein